MANKKPRGIRKRGENWYVNFRRPGIRKEVCVGPNYQEALALRKEIKAGKTIRSLTIQPSSRNLTYSEAITEHWDRHLKFKKAARTMKCNLNTSERVFGSREIHQIDWQEIETFRNERLEVVKPSVVVKELTMMSAVFKRQIKAGRLVENPVTKVDLPEFNDKRELILTDEEFRRLINVEWTVKDNGGTYQKGLDPHVKLTLLIADYTAMRVGEILNMRWADVDLENGFIYIPVTKNKERRMVPIHDELKKILEANKTQSEHVVNLHGQGVKNINKGFRKARVEAKLSNAWIHDLRHRAITRWVQNGYPPNLIMKATGHKTYSAFNRYSNLKGDDVQVLVGKKKAPIPFVTLEQLRKVG
ncbi:MAG: hypothetical protein A2487_13555 [Candidatus Raymondbacteria bacterium RifOxyC12_full_50_8]|uniref:Tyr recombinase domain-containing protein n=1 Tax=Candidatus Raymondbacteria bacterium RIFOXYD12_FULL_49_13 TaxID=1817890 RepID=A0A1F7F7S0_UNCRA|nr:MAG: hypothetical protein A2248_13665 [Candidatus Raymondbacteria bacterium RIFOXYA2_FULL_49_16]OGJ95173.1 MAG: hypothetical protein A2350_09520 [Candidatus Raymondbacteria bacterium RifOxyB12_full_50_8]OGK00385.1 MAG: hypothetical protein A2487_13555 [Candidatus Raymondbacteria bacterium RifOxyC12_full_50_8]OGK02699.1 MAG: hypothetical protein A2519_09560 [Candidatus Raymondbacteria bacterium RIFOXYD12_FULL_49_13]OGP42345.1 MAG: hypothetical protein A2324_20230 [Candidatus Raymondbacteria b